LDFLLYMHGRLREIQRNWELLAATDPFWAVLADDTKRGNRWDPNEFFKTGVAEINYTLASLPAPVNRERALDFGCGVGRLTQGLALHFDEAIGVDIAPTMIELARAYNRFGNRAQYLLNQNTHLRVFPDAHFDFVYSVIVLQHVLPSHAKGYIAEFLRVTRPGGMVVFQIPSARKAASGSLARSIYYRVAAEIFVPLKHLLVMRKHPFQEMRGVFIGDVIRLLDRNGGLVREVRYDEAAGADWYGYRYFVVRL
jgi:SAM-dependent methyltransferase